MGEHCVMMTRDKEGPMNHETHAKEWNFNTFKTVESVIRLDLIAILIMKSYNIDNGKIDSHMSSRETRTRIESTTKFANYFNQDSEVETKSIKRMMK